MSCRKGVLSKENEEEEEDVSVLLLLRREKSKKHNFKTCAVNIIKLENGEFGGRGRGEKKYSSVWC